MKATRLLTVIILATAALIIGCTNTDDTIASNQQAAETESVEQPAENLGNRDYSPETDAWEYSLETGVRTPIPAPKASYFPGCEPEITDAMQRADLALYLKRFRNGEWDGTPEYRDTWSLDKAYAEVKDGILRVGDIDVGLEHTLEGTPTTEEVVRMYNNGEWGTIDGYDQFPTVWSEDGQTQWIVFSHHLYKSDPDGWHEDIAIIGATPFDCEFSPEGLSRLFLDGEWDGSPIYNRSGEVAEYNPYHGIMIQRNSDDWIEYDRFYPALNCREVGCRIGYDDETGLTIAVTTDGTIGVYRQDGTAVAQVDCSYGRHAFVAFSAENKHETLVYGGEGNDIVYKVDLFADGSATITPRYEGVIGARYNNEGTMRISYEDSDGIHTVNWYGKEISEE